MLFVHNHICVNFNLPFIDIFDNRIPLSQNSKGVVALLKCEKKDANVSLLKTYETLLIFLNIYIFLQVFFYFDNNTPELLSKYIAK